MIVIYNKLTKKELKASAKETIAKVNEWFNNNPRRKVCKAELWYGKVHKIRRDHVEEDIQAIVKNTDTK